MKISFDDQVALVTGPADVVLWLCSSAASYVTGQSIAVDGGLIMRQPLYGYAV